MLETRQNKFSTDKLMLFNAILLIPKAFRELPPSHLPFELLIVSLKDGHFKSFLNFSSDFDIQ